MAAAFGLHELHTFVLNLMWFESNPMSIKNIWPSVHSHGQSPRMYERILECVYESCLRVLTTRERLAQFILLNARSVKLLIVKTQQVTKRIFPELTDYTLICRFFSSTDWLNIKVAAVIRVPVSVSHIRNALLKHTMGFQQLKAPLRTGEQLILKCVMLLRRGLNIY